MRTALVAIVALALPAAASATGGVWCDAGDENIQFHFKAAMSRDGTGPWFDIGGKLDTKAGNLPKSIASFDIKARNLTERWMGRRNVMLQIQNYDTELLNTVILTVVAHQVDEGSYKGIYDLRVTTASDGETHSTKTGSVTCEAD